MKNNICFAYYSKNKFIGWYGDSFGELKDIPKLYTYSEDTIRSVSENFKKKIKKIEEYNFKESENLVSNVSSSLNVSMNQTDIYLSRMEDLSLWIVECPVYEGSNKSFSKEEYDKILQEYENKKKDTLGDLYNEPNSMEKIIAIRKFKKNNPIPIKQDWVGANMEELKEWAKKTPKKNVGIIKFDKK